MTLKEFSEGLVKGLNYKGNLFIEKRSIIVIGQGQKEQLIVNYSNPKECIISENIVVNLDNLTIETLNNLIIYIKERLK